MKYRVLTGFCLTAGVDVYPGDEVEVPEHLGTVLVSTGRLRPLPVEDPLPPVVSSFTTSAEVANRDPARPRVRGRKEK